MAVQKKMQEILRFPREVGTNEVPNYITFRPVQINFGPYGDAGSLEKHGNAFSKKSSSGGFSKPSSKSTTKKKGRFEKFVEGAIDGAASYIKQSFSNAVQRVGSGLISKITGGRLQARVDLSNLSSLMYNEGKGKGSTKVTKMPGINLYMPPSLQMKLSGKYAKTALGAFGATAVQFADNNGFEKFKETYSSHDNKKLAVNSIVADFIRADGTSSALLQRGAGKISNAYTYAMFNGMEHREFSYSFRLVARNKDDTDTIKSICDSFTYYMLPVKPDGQMHFFDIPYMWEISYNRYDNKNAYLDQPNECFLKDLDIKFNTDPTFGHTHDNGAPLDVTISVSFMEIEPLYRKDNDFDISYDEVEPSTPDAVFYDTINDPNQFGNVG